MEAGQPAQLTGTNRSIGLSVRIQRQRSLRDPARNRARLVEQCPGDTPGPIKSEIRDQRSKGGSPPPQQDTPHNSLPPAALPRPWTPAFPPDQVRGLKAHGVLARPAPRGARRVSRRFGRPGGHSEGQNTRSHPELGRENPQRRWYCASRRGRVGRRQARQTAPGVAQQHRQRQAKQSSPRAPKPHHQPLAHTNPYRGVEQPGSSSGS